MKFKICFALLPFLFFSNFIGVRADYGTHFLANTRLAVALNDPNKKISFRFTCSEDTNIIAVSVYCERAKTPPSYLASLQEDLHGIPSSNPLDSAGITPKGGGWMTVPLNEVTLMAGKVYHLVLEWDSHRGGDHPVGLIDADHYASFSYTDFPNRMRPLDESSDPKMNVLVFEKGKWKELDTQPLYILHGSGQRLEGNPYDSMGERPIHGNGTPDNPSDDLIQGQALHPHYGFFPKGFLIRARKQGHPTFPLNYRVYIINHLVHTTTLAFKGEALRPEQVTAQFRWVSIGLNPKDGPRDFPPECRYVVFQTNSGRGIESAPGCEDCYLISDVGNSGGVAGGSELTFDGGAHLSRSVYSADGWKTWIDEFERDSHVVILGPVPNLSPNQPVEAIPTPLPVMRFLSP